MPSFNEQFFHPPHVSFATYYLFFRHKSSPIHTKSFYLSITQTSILPTKIYSSPWNCQAWEYENGEKTILSLVANVGDFLDANLLLMCFQNKRIIIKRSRKYTILQDSAASNVTEACQWWCHYQWVSSKGVSLTAFGSFTPSQLYWHQQFAASMIMNWNKTALILRV